MMPEIDIMELSQQNLCDYFLEKYNLEIDPKTTEIFIIKPRLGPIIIKFLEHLNPELDISNEDTDDEEEDQFIEKMYSGRELKQGLEFLLGNDYSIEYAFSVNKVLEDKIKSKPRVLFQILAENGIEIFYKNHPDFNEKLKMWVFA